jgi:hypothetical protein
MVLLARDTQPSTRAARSAVLAFIHARCAETGRVCNLCIDQHRLSARWHRAATVQTMRGVGIVESLVCDPGDVFRRRAAEIDSSSPQPVRSHPAYSRQQSSSQVYEQKSASKKAFPHHVKATTRQRIRESR